MKAVAIIPSRIASTRLPRKPLRQILGKLQGLPMPPVTQFEPVLLTRENINGKMRELRSMIDTFPVETRSKWMVGP